MADPDPSPAAALRHPFGDATPAPGATIEVADGVYWLRMPLPFALDHINLWLLRDRLDDGTPGGAVEGWTIVDCGVTDDATRSAWEQVFASGLGGLPVLRVIVTHMHPDHIGLAHWLTERWRTPERDCRLWISATDYQAARVASASTTGFGGDAAAAFFASHGLTDPASLAKVRARANYYAGMVPKVPAQYRRLADDMTLAIGGRRWRTLAGYGHAPEHMALHCPELGLLISGDMVLPRISTNVSVHDLEPEGDPLALYLRSIGAMRALPADTLVLPSHGLPFVGLHARIGQLEAHHEARLADVMQACADGPRDAASLLGLLLRRQLDLHQTTFAMGEAVAHLNLPWHQGRLVRARAPDGVWRYAVPGAA